MTILLDTVSIAIAALVVMAWIPGLWLGPGTPSRSRMRRVVVGCVLVATAGWFLGPAVLEAEVSLVPVALTLFLSLAVLGEGTAGRGVPSAGAMGAGAFACGLLLDMQERTGERISVGAWVVIGVVGIACATGIQFVWRGVWNRFHRRPAELSQDANR